MLCPKCGYYSEQEETICPVCGKILQQAADSRNGGAQAIRQGKRAREAATAKPAVRRTQETQPRRTGSEGRRNTLEMPVVQDTRSEAADENENPQNSTPTFERRRRRLLSRDRWHKSSVPIKRPLPAGRAVVGARSGSSLPKASAHPGKPQPLRTAP